MRPKFENSTKHPNVTFIIIKNNYIIGNIIKNTDGKWYITFIVVGSNPWQGDMCTLLDIFDNEEDARQFVSKGWKNIKKQFEFHPFIKMSDEEKEKVEKTIKQAKKDGTSAFYLDKFGKVIQIAG